MTDWLEQLWYPQAGEHHSLLQRVALLLLLPLSWLFAVVARQRRLSLSETAEPSPVPTLIVGNLTVGGTGKTPLVIALIKRLQADGVRVGVISRGYGGKPHHARDYPLSVARFADAALVGDEPLLIFRATGAPVFVDPDRPRARRALVNEHRCDVVISDDGLQHYALSRDFELVVVDAKRGLGNGYCLPAGPLREPPARLKQVDMLILNHGVISSVACPASLISLSSLLFKTTAVDMQDRTWSMTLRAETLRPLHARGDDVTGASAEMPAPGSRLTAVAGIGNPGRFFNALRALGYIVQERPFPDHHSFEVADFNNIEGPVVMTEKDAVKCQTFLPEAGRQFWVLAVSASISEACYHHLVSHLLGVVRR